MASNKKLDKSLTRFYNKKETVKETLFGELGIPIDGVKRVDVPGRYGYVYVRLHGNRSELIQAYNASVPSRYDYPVIVERVGGSYSVLGKNQVIYSNMGNAGATSGYAPTSIHGGQHSFNPSIGMGADPVWVYPQQFMPNMVYPSGTSMQLAINPHFYEWNGQIKYYSVASGTPDFTPYVPTVTGSARMALLWMNGDTNRLEIAGGPLFSGSITNPYDLAGYIPDIDYNNGFGLAAVKLVTGTTSLSYSEVYDVRNFFSQNKRWNGIGILDSGVPQGTGTSLNFGNNLSVSFSGGVVTIDGQAGGGSAAITAQDDGILLATGTVFNFTGDGVTATASGTVFNINIPGGGSSGTGTSGGITLIEEISPSGTGTISFTGISSAYQKLIIEYMIRGTNASASVSMDILVNGDATDSNYRRTILTVYGAGTIGGGGGDDNVVNDSILASSAPANEASYGIIEIPFYANTTFYKQISTKHGQRRDTSSVQEQWDSRWIDWENTNAITSIGLSLSAGNFAAGSSIKLYGLSDSGSGGGSGGSPITAQDEGIFLATGTVFNFVGDGVTTTASGTVFNVNIPGGGSGGGNPITAQDDGVLLGTGTVFNFRGDGVTTTVSGTVFDINIPGGGSSGSSGGNPIVAQDEGVFLATGTVFNFVGDGVTATASGTVFNINIPGGGSSGGGTGSIWTLIADEDGSSFANWTNGGGTWSSDGTVIKQTDTAATWRTAYFTTGTITPVVHIFEADVKMVSTGGGALRVISLVSGYSGGTTSQGGQIDMRLEGGQRYVMHARGFTAELLRVSFPFNDDTFYKLRLKSSGGMISAYVDGLHVGTAAATPDNSTDARRFGLASYACEAHFKNIKMWELTEPDSGGVGATTFLELTDTPSSYSGQSGTVPRVNSTEDGLEFVTLSSGGRTLIEESLPSGTATVTFSSIPATYKKLTIEFMIRSTRAATVDTLNMQLNGDTTATNYRYVSHRANQFGAVVDHGNSNAVSPQVNADTTATGYFAQGICEITQYTNTGFKKAVHLSLDLAADSTPFQQTAQTTLIWNSTSAITQIAFVFTSGNFKNGSVLRLYGEN